MGKYSRGSQAKAVPAWLLLHHRGGSHLLELLTSTSMEPPDPLWKHWQLPGEGLIWLHGSYYKVVRKVRESWLRSWLPRSPATWPWTCDSLCDPRNGDNNHVMQVAGCWGLEEEKPWEGLSIVLGNAQGSSADPVMTVSTMTIWLVFLLGQMVGWTVS